MIKRTLIYGFPFFLIALEGILRAALKIDSQTFMGPTLAAFGLGYLIPLIVPKQRGFSLSEELINELKEKKITVTTSKESMFIDIILIFIFLLTVLWVYSLYLSSAKPTLIFLGMPAYLLIGFINYFVGVLFSVLKEII